MSVNCQTVHRAFYRYAKDMRFGQLSVLFGPRYRHDLRVLATDLRVSPTANIRLVQDPHSNSIALV